MIAQIRNLGIRISKGKANEKITFSELKILNIMLKEFDKMEKINTPDLINDDVS